MGWAVRNVHHLSRNYLGCAILALYADPSDALFEARILELSTPIRIISMRSYDPLHYPQSRRGRPWYAHKAGWGAK